MTPDDLRQRAIHGGVEERLVYADWLEERGEPLGELIRLACLKERCEVSLRRVRSAGFDSSIISPRLDELRTAVLAPIVRLIDEAWPKCGCQIELDYIRPVIRDLALAKKASCRACNGLGRLGKLWRDCPECIRGTERHSLHLGHAMRKCTRCSGYGVLWEVPCKRCNELDNAGIQGLCLGCQGAGYIRSPIADLHELLALTYDPRADDVRRCDVTVLLSFLNSQN